MLALWQGIYCQVHHKCNTGFEKETNWREHMIPNALNKQKRVGYFLLISFTKLYYENESSHSTHNVFCI
jgi:hypothetical protein